MGIYDFVLKVSLKAKKLIHKLMMVTSTVSSVGDRINVLALTTSEFGLCFV